MCVCVADAMNQQVLILLAVFVVAAISTLIRGILFNLAGERFVARLRKNVSHKLVSIKTLILMHEKSVCC